MTQLVHPLIQCARGALTDDDPVECERLLSRAVTVAKDLEDVVEAAQTVDRCHRSFAESVPFQPPEALWDLFREKLIPSLVVLHATLEHVGEPGS